MNFTTEYKRLLASLEAWPTLLTKADTEEQWQTGVAEIRTTVTLIERLRISALTKLAGEAMDLDVDREDRRSVLCPPSLPGQPSG